MDKYLFQLLQSQNTIIIPGLGALTITNEKTGEIMFMPYLKYDDGQLIKHIAEKENWTEFDVKNLIAKYVREIEAKLDKGETYEMFNFGRFIKNKDGDVEFQNWGKFSSDEATKSEVETPLTTHDEIEETPSENIPEAEIPSIEISTEPEELPTVEEITFEASAIEETESEPIVEEEAQNTLEDPISEEEIIEHKISEEHVISSKVEIADQRIGADKIQQDNSYVPKEEMQPSTPPAIRKKKSFAFISLITIAVIGIIFAISCIFFYDQLKSVFPFMANSELTKTEKNVFDTLTDQSEDFEAAEAQRIEAENNSLAENVDQAEEKIEDTTPQEVAPMKEAAATKEVVQPDIKQEKETRPTTKSTTGNYHVIIGGFGEESNAIRFAEKMQGSVLGKYDGLHLVAAGSYESSQAANEALKSLGKGWILKK